MKLLIRDPDQRLGAQKVVSLLENPIFDVIDPKQFKIIFFDEEKRICEKTKNLKILKEFKINPKRFSFTETTLLYFDNHTSVAKIHHFENKKTLELTTKNEACKFNKFSWSEKYLCLSKVGDIKIWNLDKKSIIFSQDLHLGEISMIQICENFVISFGNFDHKFNIFEIIDDNVKLISKYKLDLSVVNLKGNEKFSFTVPKSLNKIQMIDHESQKVVLEFITPEEIQITDYFFREDFVISSHNDLTIRIWSVSQQKCLKILGGHLDTIQCLQMLSNEIFISGSLDKSIRFWNIHTGNCVGMFKHSSGIVQFSERFQIEKSIEKEIKTSKCIGCLKCGHCLKYMILCCHGDLKKNIPYCIVNEIIVEKLTENDICQENGFLLNFFTTKV
jgi:WD40 repeat protein